MDYSRATLQGINLCPTPAPVANVYPSYENPFRLPPIPENREVTVHPPAGDCRAPPPVAYSSQQPYDYEMQTMQNHQSQAAYQMQQPIQTTQTTPYAGTVPMEFNLHSSIPGEVIWFNLSLAKVSTIQFLF